jgi:putative tricarboxylic transport membrane protein
MRTGVPRGFQSDRIAGFIVILTGLVVAVEARGFTVGFVTDPLGPKAFPLLAAGLLLVGGVALVARPLSESSWPARQAWIRLAVGAASLVAYATLLSTLGFFVSTTSAVAVFSLLLGGRPLPSLASAASISAVLYVLFQYVLRIALPIGSLFLRGGQ